MRAITIITATDGEYAAVKRAVDRMCAENPSQGRPMVVCFGVGKVYAAAATTEAIINNPKGVILNIGLAGGLRGDMAIGEVYSVLEAVQYDFDLSKVNGKGIGTLDGEESPYIKLNTVDGYMTEVLGTADRFASTIGDRGTLLDLDCGLCDMEGAAIAQVCARACVPCYSVKVVSDLASKPSQVEQYAENARFALERIEAELPRILGLICANM